MTQAADRNTAHSRGVRNLFRARIPWLSAVIVACVVGFMSWATVKAAVMPVHRRGLAWSRGTISYEDALAASLRGEAVIVDTRPQEEREQAPVPGGAILTRYVPQEDFSKQGPGGIPEDLLESLQDVPLYMLCSVSKEARRNGLRISQRLRERQYKVELIKQEP